MGEEKLLDPNASQCTELHYLMESTHVVDDEWVKEMMDEERRNPHRYVCGLSAK